MKIVIIALFMVFCLPFFAHAETSSTRVRLQTNHGDIVLELDAQAAPKTVENFLAYVNDGFYDGTVFHRVIKEFMIQGGGFTKDMEKKSTREPIMNEADNGLANVRGTIAMARTNDPHSATSQFFINTVDNSYLDHKSKSAKGWGYCVFGKVIEGMDVVEAIENVPKTNKAGHRDVPVDAVVIQRVMIEE